MRPHGKEEPNEHTARFHLPAQSQHASLFYRSGLTPYSNKPKAIGNCSLATIISEDGAWDFLQNLARKEERVCDRPGPREGIVSELEQLPRAGRVAKYVYIATSDDTMAPDCLAKMVAALEEHKDCDLAHCPLRLIDEKGARVTDQSWPECTLFRGRHRGTGA